MYENSIRNVVGYEQMKERLGDRGNSIAWLLWHLARTEDVVVQVLIQGGSQVLQEGDWPERLGVDATHIGTGLGDDEVGDFTKALNVEAVDEYWQSVAKASYQWLKSVRAEELEMVPELNERLVGAPNVLGGASNEAIIAFWNGQSARQLFQGVVISHGFIHIGQMQEIGGRLGKVGWF